MAVVDKRLYKEVGTRVYNLRTKSGLSRQYMADQMQISAKFLYEIEKGRKGFTVQVLNNLATIFGTSCDYLVRGEEATKAAEPQKAPEPVKAPEPPKKPESNLDKALKLYNVEEQDMIAIILRAVYSGRKRAEKKSSLEEEWNMSLCPDMEKAGGNR